MTSWRGASQPAPGRFSVPVRDMTGLGLSCTSLELLGNGLPARCQMVIVGEPAFEALKEVW